MIGGSRAIFVAAIFAGSFLLFLVQPLVARLALPLLGGAPNVWNSAMLVYQALLLGGYAYAHLLSRYTPRRQAAIQLALLVLAGLTLPIALADLPPPAPGWEVLWVPALLAATIGPVFFLVSAQASLLQRWYAAGSGAGAGHGEGADPYWLYAASNIGSFAGLIAYPLVLEPELTLSAQSLVWTAGYVLLIVLTALAAWRRWNVTPMEDAARIPADVEPIGARRILLWLALAAVPSGLMLSTTTHLTTDIVAVPLLWVIPLGLYLLSFVFAFNPRSQLGGTLARAAPTVILLAGALAMVTNTGEGLSVALAAVLMLLVVAVALHRRLYALRPDPARLTLFYLVMAAGGALGGVFTALVAPVVFDWAWEHPLLVLAAAALLPDRALLPWMDWLKLSDTARRAARIALVVLAAIGGAAMAMLVKAGSDGGVQIVLLIIAALGVLALGRRWAFLAILLILMVARGGFLTLEEGFEGQRERSYFGIYTVRDTPDGVIRSLLHGTTLHGRQYLQAPWRDLPTTYYGKTSGVGLALTAAPALYGPHARIGVVGLGTGTLACYRQPGQSWTFFEIDRTVIRYSREGTFTFLRDCAPDARVVVGDARLKLAQAAPESFDMLVIDAFSSDAIPLHLLTREALETYAAALSPNGLLLLHISNRYIDLEPVLAAHMRDFHWRALVRNDPGRDDAGTMLSGSSWVAIARAEAPLAAMLKHPPQHDWVQLTPPAAHAWTDDYASILPFLRWRNVLGGQP